MLKKLHLSVLLLASAFVAVAQDVDHVDLTYTYVQLPMKSLKPVVNYQSFVELAYEEKSLQVKKDYETAKANASGNYDREIAIWEKQCADERARYDKEMAAYNAKSGAKKVLEKEFLDESKPRLNLPYKPSMQEPVMGDAQKLFDKKMLAGSYLNLEGFNNASSNAVKYTATLFGFESFEPELVKNSFTVTKNNVPETKYNFYYVIRYKHAMSVKVELPDGTVLLTQTMDKFNTMSTYKTSEFNNEYDLQKSFNKSSVLAHLEESITTANLKEINIMVNDKFGFAKRQRKIELYTVQTSKKADYSDVAAAYGNAKDGLNALTVDDDKAKMLLTEASAQLEKIIAESNPADKKARIDKKVTEALCYDAFEVNLQLRNFEACKKAIAKLNTLDPSKSDLKKIEGIKTLLTDSEMRFKANQ